MEEKTVSKTKRPDAYPETLLARFDVLYQQTDIEELDKILRKEFPKETKNRSTDLGIWRSLASRRGIKKGKVIEMNDTINVNPSTPDVALPTAITFGHTAYPIDLLKSIGHQMSKGLTVGKAYKTIAEQQGFVMDEKCISSLTNFFRIRFNAASMSDFYNMPVEKIDLALQKEQRVELVRILKNEKWRDLAIIEKSADLFPDLDPLTLKDIQHIRNFWRVGKKETRRKAVSNVESVPTVKSLAKMTDSYILSIVGPLLKHEETVTLAKARTILRTVLTEGNHESEKQ